MSLTIEVGRRVMGGASCRALDKTVAMLVNFLQKEDFGLSL